MKKIFILLLALFACMTVAPKAVVLEPQVSMERVVEVHYPTCSPSNSPSSSPSSMTIWFYKVKRFFVKLFSRRAWA